MKTKLTIILSLLFYSVFSQKINFDLLAGTWLCYKATQGSKDVTESYKEHYAMFKSDSTYIEERRYNFNTIKGKYHLDKKNKIISYENMISTTKYPNAKTKMNDLIMSVNLDNEIIVSLDNENLIILLKGSQNKELNKDTKIYYKRQK